MAGEFKRDKDALNAAQGDLREFIRQASEANELVSVKDADPNLEIGAIYELSQNESIRRFSCSRT